jgi:hypothetical protein
MAEKANSFDKVGVIRHEVNNALVSLKELRQKFPFAENLREIEWIDPDKLYKINPDEVGEFFQLLENSLKPIKYSNLSSSSNVYRNARLQIKDFKNLLRTAVDERKSLAQKVDVPWEKIGGIGQDKTLPKKIIYCLSYERGNVLPIFNNQHLRHFVNRIIDVPSGQTKYFSFGQEYEQYTVELVKAKNSAPITKGWDSLYFASFLYNTYPPPDSEPAGVNATSERRIGYAVTNEQLDLQGFMKLLGELQKQGKITGEEFRENRTLWMQQPSEQEGLSQRLKKRLS